MRQRKSANLILVLLMCVGRTACLSGSMRGWLTTGDHTILLRQLPTIYGRTGGGSGVHISVDRNKRYQTMEGFGAALTSSAAYVIHNSPEYDEIVNELFSPYAGIGISYIRLPMGASDIQAEAPYTYADTPYDFNLDHFSIQKDRQFILPVIKKALRVNPTLKIVGTPWTAPAWMKNTNRLQGGQLKWDANVNEAYAKYFVKFIQSYQNEGINITAVTVQNEPLNGNNQYPTMEMSWQQESEFVKHHLGPMFRSNNIKTKILIYDHNWDNIDYANNILNDHETSQYVSGVAWHCYAGDKNAPLQVHNSHPNVDMYFTECSGGDWATDFSGNLMWNTATLFIAQPRAWTKTVLLWNLALDENHGPHVQTNGGCKTCRGALTVNSHGGYTKEVEFYLIGHLSKFVKPGAVRIDSSTGQNTNTVAFQNPDGSVAVLIQNSDSSSHDVTIQVNNDGRSYTYNMPGHAIATFVL
ncbi:endo-1,6-beta-D-glucanase neg1-like [Mizuhopecten yessoensis]|uniref:Glucosylceramidase n=1 Tax=Mizuhopecten yessoensis TaxID=6573 RepID=A0A210QW48_MIZYE|nr:endo-1,6-beta-D-glucanase neg1-like [Mizuhopecten yessoensis]OWF52934.1 Endo-1,6-beta-D-glucanase [Mizuhopecten yessoensis]